MGDLEEKHHQISQGSHVVMLEVPDPTGFTVMMNDIISGYLDDFVLVFLDGILVYSCIVEQYAEHLGKLLKP